MELELAAWLGHAPAREALDGPDDAPAARATTPADLVATLVALCDWEVEALARAALGIGELARPVAGPAPALAAARAFVDCPCLTHARAGVAAAGGGAADGPAAQVVDLAALLTLRAREARHVQELEALVGLLVGATAAAGVGLEEMLGAVRESVVPWALTRARMVGEVCQGPGS
ncbi:MAG: hypothetical protein M9894_08070 [Planctomycetes bacterium]|nr:hypothetical protein [Planctomycetota bacterium]